MAYEGPQIKLPGLTANADLSAKQYYYVKLVGAGLVDVCSAVTDIPIGVLQNNPVSGMPAEVRAGRDQDRGERCHYGRCRNWYERQRSRGCLRPLAPTRPSGSLARWSPLPARPMASAPPSSTVSTGAWRLSIGVVPMAQPTQSAVHVNRPLTNISVAYMQGTDEYHLRQGLSGDPGRQGVGLVLRLHQERLVP